MAAPLLETRNLTMRFGGVKAVATSTSPGRRRAALPDRPQRRRQEHLLQDADRPVAADPATCCSAARTYPRARAHEVARLGVGIKTQVPNVFDGLSVRENIWLAARRIHSGRNAAQPSTRCWSGSA